MAKAISSGTALFATPPAARDVRRILVCQLRQIGDVLLATPSIELLHRHYPQADIHVLTEKKCLPMLENNPHIKKIWPLDKATLRNPFKGIRFYRNIAAAGFDLVVDFQQLPRCHSAVFRTRAKIRLSFTPPWYFKHMYTHWSNPEPAYAAAHKAAVLAPLSIVWSGERPRLYLTEAERAEARHMLAGGNLAPRRFIGLDVTHRHPTRRWPARHYAALMDLIAGELPDFGYFMPYGPGEEDEVRAIRELCAVKDKIFVPPRMLGLRQLAACIDSAAVQIGNCSSPRHMAVALDVPSITVLGSTSPDWTFPSPEHIDLSISQYMPMPCQHCNRNICALGTPCLEQLAPEMILPRVLKHIRQYARLDEAMGV